MIESDIESKSLYSLELGINFNTFFKENKN